MKLLMFFVYLVSSYAWGRGTHSAPSVTSPETGMAVAIHNMTTSRAVHTVTLLRNGKVLITGGFDAGGRTLASTELYDPDSKTFMPAGAMNVARQSHTATLLPNGKVLITGGINDDYLSSAELYDPGSGKFTMTGHLTTPRHSHAAVLLNNGKVLVVGGVGTGYSFLSSAELYDPSTGEFERTGSMTTPRESHTITLLKNGKVLITGGHKGRHAGITIYSSAELYDPRTGTCAETGNMAIRRHKHDATLLPNGKVLISGGSDERDDRGQYVSTELYDPDGGTFSAGPNMNAARYKHRGTSVVLKNGDVLLIGGTGMTEVYDPTTNTFDRAENSVGVTRLFAASMRLPSGDVLFTGGYGPDISASAQAWVFIP